MTYLLVQAYQFSASLKILLVILPITRRELILKNVFPSKFHHLLSNNPEIFSETLRSASLLIMWDEVV
jgi:hypothetical protein